MTSDLFNSGPRSLPANPIQPEEPDNREFGWDEVALDVELQCPTAVYQNGVGGVTIRQDQTGMMGEDVIIVLSSADAVRAVIKALQRELEGM